jgi:ABC-type transport system involved in cytochrome c biogenesis permease subunit
MPKYAPAAAASTLCSLPILWSVYFGITYRCDLNRYGHLWSNGTKPAWLTGWELAVTAAGIVVSFILIPPIALLWTRGKPLGRGEWITMVIVAALVGVAIFIAPAAMMDPAARFNALFGDNSGVCPH